MTSLLVWLDNYCNNSNTRITPTYQQHSREVTYCHRPRITLTTFRIRLSLPLSTLARSYQIQVPLLAQVETLLLHLPCRPPIPPPLPFPPINDKRLTLLTWLSLKYIVPSVLNTKSPELFWKILDSASVKSVFLLKSM